MSNIINSSLKSIDLFGIFFGAIIVLIIVWYIISEIVSAYKVYKGCSMETYELRKKIMKLEERDRLLICYIDELKKSYNDLFDNWINNDK